MDGLFEAAASDAKIGFSGFRPEQGNSRTYDHVYLLWFNLSVLGVYASDDAARIAAAEIRKTSALSWENGTDYWVGWADREQVARMSVQMRRIG